jgi:hypothetical protein
MDETFVVFGGGCFGTHHVRGIERGRTRGRISPQSRIIMLDRNAHPPALDLPEVGENPHLTFVQSDWLEYMKANWDSLPAEAEAVPAPVAPHLAFEWLVWSLRGRLGEDSISIEPMAHEFGGLPYEYLAPSGARFISAADWICPINCRAPHICPMIRDVRTWELSGTVNAYAQEHQESVAAAVVFEPRFRVPGIDRLYLHEYRDARDRILDLYQQPQSAGKEVIVATVSPCHGAVSLMRLNAPAPCRKSTSTAL